jgi:hypothetical protein
MPRRFSSGAPTFFSLWTSVGTLPVLVGTHSGSFSSKDSQGNDDWSAPVPYNALATDNEIAAHKDELKTKMSQLQPEYNLTPHLKEVPTFLTGTKNASGNFE